MTIIGLRLQKNIALWFSVNIYLLYCNDRMFIISAAQYWNGLFDGRTMIIVNASASQTVRHASS